MTNAVAEMVQGGKWRETRKKYMGHKSTGCAKMRRGREVGFPGFWHEQIHGLDIQRMVHTLTKEGNKRGRANLG